MMIYDLKIKYHSKVGFFYVEILIIREFLGTLYSVH